MRGSILFRRAAVLVAGTAVSAGLLAAPADAREVASSVAPSPTTGPFASFTEDDYVRLIDSACGDPNRFNKARPVIMARSFARVGDLVEGVVISAKVDRNGDRVVDGATGELVYDYESRCNFAAFRSVDNSAVTGFSSYATGSYAITAGSTTTTSTTVKGDGLTHTWPISTKVDEPATVTVTATGEHVSKRQGTYLVPRAPRTAAQIAQARRKLDSVVRSAKKTYAGTRKRAGKIKNVRKRAALRARAKKKYVIAKADARAQYDRSVATPAPLVMNGVLPVNIPFEITVGIAPPA